MNQKYEKPLANNLGELFSAAQGYCLAGSVANGVSGTQPCTSGGIASGGYCQNGGQARDSQGNAPCRTGGEASYNCTGGSAPNLGPIG